MFPLAADLPELYLLNALKPKNEKGKNRKIEEIDQVGEGQSSLDENRNRNGIKFARRMSL